VLHADADQAPRRTIVELSNTILRSLGDEQKNSVRKLVTVDQSGPSPDGPGHKRALPFYSQPNN